MNQLIKTETVDFKTLINNNSISLTVQTRLTEAITNEFTDEESNWYIANLYMYMNYHPTDEFPINLDNILKLIGFAHKKNAKRTLENNFTEGEDYKIIKLPREQNQNAAAPYGAAGSKNIGGGGLNHETIMLNVDTFKHLCMLIKTEQGKKIRKYYVKLENIYNQLVREELQNKILELEQSHSNDKHNILVTSFDNRKVVYLGYIGNNKIKYGWSNSLKQRVDDHRKVYGKHFTLIHVTECAYNKTLEERLKQFCNSRIINFQDKKGNNHKEIIQLDDEFSQEVLIETLEVLKTNVIRELEQPDKLIIEKLNTLQDMYTNLEQKLHAKFENKIVNTPLLNIKSEIVQKPSTSSKPSNFNLQQTIPEIPPTITDMRVFYNHWKTTIKQKYADHIALFSNIQWKKLFGENGKVIGKRHHQTKDWLEFLDNNPNNLNELLTLFENFAVQHNLTHSVIVKKLFYHALRPNIKLEKAYVKLVPLLKSYFINAGYDITKKYTDNCCTNTMTLCIDNPNYNSASVSF